MNKTKATPMGKTGGNSPAGATLMGTDKTRVGGQIPATAPLPAAGSQFPGLAAGAPTLDMPNPQDSQTLPMFNVSAGHSDAGAHTGDLGGAGGIAGSATTGAM
jgi:hypothetical protein